MYRPPYDHHGLCLQVDKMIKKKKKKFPSVKCQACRKGDKVCSGLEGLTCRQCMRDQKGCSTVVTESESEHPNWAGIS